MTKNKKLVVYQSPARRTTARTKKRSIPAPGGNRVAELERQLSAMSAKYGPGSNDRYVGSLLRKAGNYAGSFVTGGAIPEIFGSGSYHMKQNVLWDSNSQVPMMGGTGNSLNIRHREFVTTIGSNQGTTTFTINPGNGTVFRWLAAVASNFEEYSLKGLIFEFKSTSATAIVSGTNTAMGTVSMAFQYRADSLPPVSRQALLSEMWAVDTICSGNCIMPVECSPRENPLSRLYIRSFPDNIPAGSDIKTFDLGRLSVRSDGQQNGQSNVLGELWVSYDIQLFKPTLVPGLIGVPLHLHIGIGNDYTNARPLGQATTTLAPDQEGWAVDNVGLIITLPNAAATYRVTFAWFGNSTASLVPPVVVGTSTRCQVGVIAWSANTASNSTAKCLMGAAIVNTAAGLTAPGLGIGASGTLPTGGAPGGGIDFDQINFGGVTNELGVTEAINVTQFAVGLLPP